MTRDDAYALATFEAGLQGRDIDVWFHTRQNRWLTRPATSVPVKAPLWVKRATVHPNGSEVAHDD